MDSGQVVGYGVAKVAANVMVMVSDKEFMSRVYVGCGGRVPKTWKTLKGAQKHCHGNAHVYPVVMRNGVEYCEYKTKVV